MAESNNSRANSGSQKPFNGNYRNDGTKTPTYMNPTPMPPVKPAKTESSKK